MSKKICFRPLVCGQGLRSSTPRAVVFSAEMVVREEFRFFLVTEMGVRSNVAGKRCFLCLRLANLLVIESSLLFFPPAVKSGTCVSSAFHVFYLERRTRPFLFV